MGGAWERNIGIGQRILNSMLLQLKPPPLCISAHLWPFSARPLTPVSTNPDSPLTHEPWYLPRRLDYLLQWFSDKTTSDRDRSGCSVLLTSSGTAGGLNIFILYRSTAIGRQHSYFKSPDVKVYRIQIKICKERLKLLSRKDQDS